MLYLCQDFNLCVKIAFHLLFYSHSPKKKLRAKAGSNNVGVTVMLKPWPYKAFKVTHSTEDLKHQSYVQWFMLMQFNLSDCALA